MYITIYIKLSSDNLKETLLSLILLMQLVLFSKSKRSINYITVCYFASLQVLITLQYVILQEAWYD